MVIALLAASCCLLAAGFLLLAAFAACCFCCLLLDVLPCSPPTPLTARAAQAFANKTGLLKKLGIPILNTEMPKARNNAPFSGPTNNRSSKPKVVDLNEVLRRHGQDEDAIADARDDILAIAEKEAEEQYRAEQRRKRKLLKQQREEQRQKKLKEQEEQERRRQELIR